MPPPTLAESPETVTLVSVASPLLNRPPPRTRAELLRRMTSVSESLPPSFRIPPPFWARPPAIVSPESAERSAALDLEHAAFPVAADRQELVTRADDRGARRVGEDQRTADEPDRLGPGAGACRIEDDGVGAWMAVGAGDRCAQSGPVGDDLFAGASRLAWRRGLWFARVSRLGWRRWLGEARSPRVRQREAGESGPGGRGRDGELAGHRVGCGRHAGLAALDRDRGGRESPPRRRRPV